MTERSAVLSTKYLLGWTGLLFAVGAALAAVLTKFVAPAPFVLAATFALFADGILLGVGKDGASKLTDLAAITDPTPMDFRERWLRYLEERHLELQFALFIQYGILVLGAIFVAPELAKLTSIQEFNLKIPARVAAAIGVGLFFACIPSLWRLLAAPRRILILRHDLVTEARSVAASAETARLATVRGRERALARMQ